MKINMNIETMNRVLEVVRPLTDGDNYMSLDFGTGIVPGSEGVAGAMMNKASVTNGNEQTEVGFFTTIPEEVERPLQECNLENPLEKAVLKAADFVAVADALSQYNQAFVIHTDAAKVILTIEGTDRVIAEMPVYKADASLMKALVPHRQNSEAYELFDKDIMTIRLVGKEFLEAAKVASSLAKKTAVEQFRYYAVSVKDIPVIMQEVERSGEKVSVPRYNAKVQFMGTNRYAFASGAVNAFIHKGAGNDLLGCIENKSILQGMVSPMVSFTKSGDTITPVVESYAEFKKGYDEMRKISCGENEFLFGIPMDAMDKLMRLVAVVPEQYVDITVGEKYLYVMVNGLGCVYLTPQKVLSGAGFISAFRSGVESVARKNCNVVVDSKGLLGSLKLTQLYDKDSLYAQMPIELTVEEKGITCKKGESVSFVQAVSAQTEIATIVYGMDGDYIPCVTSGLPSGSIQFSYGVDQPLMVFTKGGEQASPEGTAILVLGFNDLDAAKKQIEDAYNKSVKEREAKKANTK